MGLVAARGSGTGSARSEAAVLLHGYCDPGDRACSPYYKITTRDNKYPHGKCDINFPCRLHVTNRFQLNAEIFTAPDKYA